MPRIGLGLGLGLRQASGGIDAQAQAHYNRVIADGGVVPAGVSGTNAFFNAVKTIYGTTDITTAVSVGVDAHYLGYKLGAGAGATSGQAAQKLYSCAGSSGDVVQTTAASQPLLLAHNGASNDNYFYSPQVNDNFCQTNNISINTNSGMSVEAKVSFTTGEDTGNSSGWICSNDDGGLNRNMFLGFSGTRTLVIYWSNLSRSATATAQIPAAYSGWIKTSLETSDSDMLVKFWTSPDGSAWTQLGATITNVGGANTFQTNNAQFYVTGNGGANTTKGKIYRVIYKNATGTIRADFNPATYNASTSQTQWTSTTGEVWTINTGTAPTGYKGVLVDRTIVMSDGIDDTILSGTIANNQYFSQHVSLNPLTIPVSPGQYYVDGGGAKGLIYAAAGTIRAYNNSELDFTGDLSLRLQYLQADFNNVSSNIYLNNANNVSGALGAAISTKSVLFSNNGSGNFANIIVSTVLSTNNFIDTPTQRTAMYNYIRSINNNAF